MVFINTYSLYSVKLESLVYVCKYACFHKNIIRVCDIYYPGGRARADRIRFGAFFRKSSRANLIEVDLLHSVSRDNFSRCLSYIEIAKFWSSFSVINKYLYNGGAHIIVNGSSYGNSFYYRMSWGFV